MNIKQFLIKNKKIIMIFLFIFVIFSGILIIYRKKLTNPAIDDKNKNFLKTSPQNMDVLQETYVKPIFSQDNPSDLKIFTELTNLQKEMLMLMKENFVILEIDWDKTIKEQKASYVGDFSQLFKEKELKPYFKPKYSLGLLSEIKDQQNKTHNITGYDNFYKLKDINSNLWSFKLRNDLLFENNTKINNETIVYSLEKQKEIIKQLYSNEDQSNLQSNLKLLLETNCLKDNNNEYIFTLSYQEPKDLYSIISLLNNLILLPSNIFEKTYKDEEIHKSNYGTREFPFSSYGPYKLINGQSYDSENDWVFEKNNYFYKKDEYPLKNIFYKKLVQLEDKYRLFNEGKINEIIIENVSDLEKIQKEKIANFLGKTTSNISYIFFKKENEEEGEEITVKEQKKKTNWFLNDARFRKALFLALDRSLLGKENFWGLNPSYSFISDLALFTDYHIFNEQEFHKKNLNNVFEMNLQKIDEKEINSQIYRPDKAVQLFEEVNREFNNNFNLLDDQQPLIIKVFSNYDSTIESKELKLNEFLKKSWETCFSKCKIQFKFEPINYYDYNIDISIGPFEQIKNVHATFLYLLDQIKIKNEQGDLQEREFGWILEQISTLKEQNQNLINNYSQINEISSLLNKLQNKIDEKNNDQKEDDFQKYCQILEQLEKHAFQELFCLPLIKHKKYKIYQNLNTDFPNSFTLWGLNDLC